MLRAALDLIWSTVARVEGHHVSRAAGRPLGMGLQRLRAGISSPPQNCSRTRVKDSLALLCAVLSAAMCLAAQSTTTQPSDKHSAPKQSHQASSSSAHKSAGKGKKSKKTASKRGQQKIDAQRAREIQQALIREHYLSGQPSGVWDDATQGAMQKFQADNGWQDKTTPDSRALIKLGLGPDHQHLLNPESAMTAPRAQASPPPAPSSDDASGKSPR